VPVVGLQHHLVVPARSATPDGLEIQTKIPCTTEVPSREPVLDLEHAQNRPLARHFVTAGARVAPQDQLS
jgi:hypothetical protein